MAPPDDIDWAARFELRLVEIEASVDRVQALIRRCIALLDGSDPAGAVSLPPDRRTLG